MKLIALFVMTIVGCASPPPVQSAPPQIIVYTVEVEVPAGFPHLDSTRISFDRNVWTKKGWNLKHSTILFAGDQFNEAQSRSTVALHEGRTTARFLLSRRGEEEAERFDVIRKGEPNWEAFQVLDGGGHYTARGIKLRVTQENLKPSVLEALFSHEFADKKLAGGQWAPDDWNEKVAFVEPETPDHDLVSRSGNADEPLAKYRISVDPPLYLLRRNWFHVGSGRRLLALDQKGRLSGLANESDLGKSKAFDATITIDTTPPPLPITIASDFLNESERREAINDAFMAFGHPLAVQSNPATGLSLLRPSKLPLSEITYRPKAGTLAVILKPTFTNIGDARLDLTLNRPRLSLTLPPIEGAAQPIQLDFDKDKDIAEINTLLDPEGDRKGGAKGLVEKAVSEVKRGVPTLKLSFRDFHQVEAALAFTSSAWTIDATGAVDKRAGFKFMSPDEDNRGEINPAGWILRANGGPKEEKPPCLDENGMISFRALRKLAKQGKCSLIPVGDEVWLEPQAFSFESSDLDKVATKLFTINPKARPVELRPKMFLGFAPVVQVKMKNDEVIKVFGESTPSGCVQVFRYGKLITTAAEKKVSLGDIVSMTPLDLASFGKTDVTTANIEKLAHCLESETPDWSTFFTSEMGLDIYTPEASTPVILRGPSGMKALEENSFSPHYKKCTSFKDDGLFSWWDGKGWIPVNIIRPGHHRVVAAEDAVKPTTAYIVISARVLDGIVTDDAPGGEDVPPIAVIEAPQAEVPPPKVDEPPKTKGGDSADEIEALLNRGQKRTKSAGAGGAPRVPNTSNPAAPRSQVKRFVNRWVRLAGSLQSELERRGYRRAVVFVVYPARDQFQVEKIADVTFADQDAFETMSKGVGSRMETLSHHFVSSKRLSPNPQRIVEIFKAHPPEDDRPGNLLLLILPEGKPGRPEPTESEPYFHVERINGFNHGSFESVEKLLNPKTKH